MKRSRPQNRLKGDLLGVFPTEIHFLILENLPQRDLGAFSLCSKFCHSLCLPLLFKSITLGPKIAKLFRNGGVHEHNRHHTQIIRLTWANAVFGSRLDPEPIYSNLRETVDTLKLFPCLKGLSIVLTVLSSTERNIYFAILKAILNSRFQGTLEDLQLDIDQRNDLFPDTDSAANKEYWSLYSGLVELNQEFLGANIPSNNDLDGFMTTNTGLLPALKRVKISVGNIPPPMDDLRSDDVQKSGFYYNTLTFAPQLRELNVKIMKHTSCARYAYDGEFEPVELDPKLIHTFSKLATLSFETCNLPQRSDIRRLGKRFPNLEHLYFQLRVDRDLWRNEWGECNSLYDDIVNLKALKTVELPWPRLQQGSVSPEALRDMTLRWLRGGLCCLETAIFKGIRYKGAFLQNMYNIQVSLKIHKTENEEWKVQIIGDTNNSEWMDCEVYFGQASG